MNWADSVFHDIRYAVRSFARSPVLTGAVVLTILIGIGLDAGVFAVLNGMFFKPRIENAPASFIQILPEYSGHWENSGLQWATSTADFNAYRTARTVDQFAAWAVVNTHFNDTSDLALLVTCNFFPLYGLEQAAQGRLFRESDCAENSSAPVIVISQELWKSSFHSSPSIVGMQVRLDHRLYTVIGITPARFAGRLRGPGIWIPYTLAANFFAGRDVMREATIPWLIVEGRLRNGYTRTEAETELNALAAHQDASLPGRKTHLVFTNGSFFQHPGARIWAVLTMPLIMGALSMVLLLACTNVTVLLLSRAAARRYEIAVRVALGASRIRLVRMLLTEGLLLGTVAGAFSAGLAWWIPDAFDKILTRAPHYPVKPDWVVFTYMAVLALLAGCIAGLAPAAESLKADLTPALKKYPFTRRGRRHRGSFLITAQVAASMVLVTGAALFVRAQHGMAGDPGFETHQVLAVPLRMTTAASEGGSGFYNALAQRVRTLPGVDSLAFASSAPFAGNRARTIAVRADLQSRSVLVNDVSPEFFDVLGIPIVRGRSFRRPSEIVISEALAREFWPAQNAIGKSIDSPSGSQTVVGIARDVQYARYGGVDGPVLYRPHELQTTAGSLLIRFRGDSAPIARQVAGVIGELDPEQTGAPYTVQAGIVEMASRFRVLAAMVVFLGVIASLLAVIGVYGVMAFAVSQRAKELAIRVALGAARRDIISCVLTPGVRPVLKGLAAGLVLSLAGTLLLSRIFRDSPVALNAWDPMVYLFVVALLLTCALLAMFRPAIRASATPPADALRQE